MYDVLAEHPVTVVGEIDVPICHCLLAGENTDLADIHEVHSHPQALQQCRHYLERHPQWVSCGSSNTALGAKMIAEEGRKDGGHRQRGGGKALWTEDSGAGDQR